MMRWPWQKRIDLAREQTDQACTEYERAVANRYEVSRLVRRIVVHGENNNVVEKLNIVARGGHR